MKQTTILNWIVLQEYINLNSFIPIFTDSFKSCDAAEQQIFLEKLPLLASSLTCALQTFKNALLYILNSNCLLKTKQDLSLLDRFSIFIEFSQ